MLLLRQPVGNSEEFNRGGPDVRGPADGDHGHVSAVRAAGNADLLEVHVPRGGKEARRMHFVLKIAAAQVLIVRLLKLHSIACGPANIWGNADVSARSQRGCRLVEAVYSLAGRAAVRQ